jgi:hypothetical protein
MGNCKSKYDITYQYGYFIVHHCDRSFFRETINDKYLFYDLNKCLVCILYKQNQIHQKFFIFKCYYIQQKSLKDKPVITDYVETFPTDINYNPLFEFTKSVIEKEREPYSLKLEFIKINSGKNRSSIFKIDNVKTFEIYDIVEYNI